MTTTLAIRRAILETLRSSLPVSSAVLHEPELGELEEKYLVDCVRSGFVSSVGQYVNQFEQQLADFTGVRRAVAVVNGTAALHVALLLGGVEPGDEVLIPALTFVATANAVSYCGAVPHFVDSETNTLGMDGRKLADYLHDIAELRHGQCFNRQTGRRIQAVVPMHTFGHSVDLDPLVEVCDQYHLVLIEDAAESLGSYYKGKHTGNFGRVAALSFNGNKVVTTGGGGAVLTNDEALANRAKHLTTTAKVPHRWAYRHDAVAYNYRLPNLNAALGCAQMEQLPGFLTQKRRLAERYAAAFADVPGVRFVTEPDFARSNYWLNALQLETADVALRDEILQDTNDAGFMTRPVWNLLHQLEMFANCPRMDLETAESLAASLVNIPSSAHLGA